MSEQPPEFRVPKPQERYRATVTTYTPEEGFRDHDLGEFRLKDTESALLYLDEEGKPFISVVPQEETLND